MTTDDPGIDTYTSLNHTCTVLYWMNPQSDSEVLYTLLILLDVLFLHTL